MNKREITAKDVFMWLFEQAKIIPVMLVVFSSAGTFIWQTQAKPLVKEVVRDTNKGMRDSVQTNTQRLDDLEEKMDLMVYEGKKTSIIIEEIGNKVIGQNQVKRINRQMEIFKPEGYDEKNEDK